jgi:hypothetical protein
MMDFQNNSMQIMAEPGIHKALRYAFPPNQLKLCGKKLEVDEYRLLFDDVARAHEFLMSLPFLGKCCARIAALRSADTFSEQVVNAYFLGIGPHLENGWPITHLMDILITDAAFIAKARSDATRGYFLSRVNCCTVRCGTVTSVDNYNVAADLLAFGFVDGKVMHAKAREKLSLLPFNGTVFRPGQMVTAHGYYAIENISPLQYIEMNAEMDRELEIFNSRKE